MFVDTHCHLSKDDYDDIDDDDIEDLDYSNKDDLAKKCQRKRC